MTLLDGTGFRPRQADPEMMYAEERGTPVIDVLLGRMSPSLREAFTDDYYQEDVQRRGKRLMWALLTGTFKSRLFRARRLL